MRSGAGAAPTTWVAGAGGLIGQHVVRAARRRGPVIDGTPIPWPDPAAAREALTTAAGRLVDGAGRRGWRMLWCAGTGVAGATAARLEAEVAAFGATLDALADAGGRGGPGTVFLSSSIGGIHAGVGCPPYDETSPVAPITDYGWAKHAMEERLRAWTRAAHGRAVIGRIANVYGPGQSLDKPQGLVSQVCAAQLDHRPVSIWASLDTLRDYVFAADAADLALDAMERLGDDPEAGDGGTVVKVIGSLRPITVGAVLGELRRVLKRQPTIVLAAPPLGAVQVRDLSTRSVVWPDLDARAMTPFPAGVHATLTDLRSRQARASTDLHRPTARGSAS